MKPGANVLWRSIHRGHASRKEARRKTNSGATAINIAVADVRNAVKGVAPMRGRNMRSSSASGRSGKKPRRKRSVPRACRGKRPPRASTVKDVAAADAAVATVTSNGKAAPRGP